MDINNVLLSLLFVRLVNGRVVSGLHNFQDYPQVKSCQTGGDDGQIKPQVNFTSLNAFQPGDNAISFLLQYDGYIILSPTSNDSRINYTIFFAGWTSKTSTIYQNFNGKSEKVAYHSMPNAAQKRRFWIGWFNGILRVGCFTGIVSQNVIMEYVIPCPFSILYVGVTSINSASWWPYEGVEYHEDTSCKVTHCDHCIRYTLRTKCPAFVMKMSVKVNSEDDCLSQCYKDDECEAFDYDRIAHVCRLFTDEVDPEGEIISPIFRRLP